MKKQSGRNPSDAASDDTASLPKKKSDPSEKCENQRSGKQRPRRRPRRKPSQSNPDGANPRKCTPQPVPIEDDWEPDSFVVAEQPGKTRFPDLEISRLILHGIADLGFEYCTPIQAGVLPETLKGRDALGQAQTGTGKTAAFLIAIYSQLLAHDPKERKSGMPRALILAPTRELALQIEKDGKDLGKYLPFKLVAIFGGMDYRRQQRSLTEGLVDIVVATPGRLLDFKQNQDLHLSKVEVLVIDEADRMLDMGFIPDVRRIVYSTPPKFKRQTLFFSATLTNDVNRLAEQWTQNAIEVKIEPEQIAVDTVQQRLYIVTTQEKFPLLLNLIEQENADRVMVFANRRDQARRLTDLLLDYNIRTALLSGDVPQSKRIKTLDRFRNGEIRVLVATDVAGRGIHVENVSHVVNFTLPQDPEDYVHRIGRTGRAGASGISISFACEEDAFQIPAIEEFLGAELNGIHPEDDLLEAPPKPTRSPQHRKAKAEEEKREEQLQRPPSRHRRRNSVRR